jgi:hypothetical protein
MDKYIVAYCTGGLGNRLIPLSQCASIAKHSGRELLLFWDEQDPNCAIRFEELYSNPIGTINRDELQSLQDVAMFCEGQANHCFECENTKWGRPMLKHLAINGAQALHRHAFNFGYENKSIVIHQDGYWYPVVNRADAHSFLRSLTPTPELLERINQWTDNLRLNKSVYGVHARGTDFHVTADGYINQMSAILKFKKDSRFLLVTDDIDFEKKIMATFPDSTCCRPQRVYLELSDPSKPWGPGNFIRTADQTKEAIVDMYLLAKTNIQISHPDSSFCNVAKILS